MIHPLIAAILAAHHARLAVNHSALAPGFFSGGHTHMTATQGSVVIVVAFLIGLVFVVRAALKA